MSKYYINDIGMEITVDCVTVITGATNTILKVKKPDGTLVEWTATIDGTTNLKYTTVAGDLDQYGVYHLQASLTIGTWVGLGETAVFRIHNKYD